LGDRTRRNYIRNGSSESLAAAIMQFDAFETSAAYAVRLKAEHGRKSGFWNLIS
jgi:hypothetical protein